MSLDKIKELCNQLANASELLPRLTAVAKAARIVVDSGGPASVGGLHQSDPEDIARLDDALDLVEGFLK